MVKGITRVSKSYRTGLQVPKHMSDFIKVVSLIRLYKRPKSTELDKELVNSIELEWYNSNAEYSYSFRQAVFFVYFFSIFH